GEDAARAAARAGGGGTPPRRDVESSVGDRVGAPALDAAIEPRPVAEQIHRSQREAAGDALGTRARVERAEAPERQAEEGRLGIAIRREPRQALDDPRPLPQPLEVL